MEHLSVLINPRTILQKTNELSLTVPNIFNWIIHNGLLNSILSSRWPTFIIMNTIVGWYSRQFTIMYKRTHEWLFNDDHVPILRIPVSLAAMNFPVKSVNQHIGIGSHYHWLQIRISIGLVSKWPTVSSMIFGHLSTNTIIGIIWFIVANTVGE